MFAPSDLFRSPAAVAIALLALASTRASAQQPLSCAGGVCTLQVHEYLAFEAPSDLFEALPGGGFRVQGGVTVKTPFHDFELPETDLTFQPAQTSSLIDFEVYGTGRPSLFALPAIGQFFENAPIATVGVATRDTLRALLETGDMQLPLTELPSAQDPDVLLEPAYVFFHYEASIELDVPLAELLGLDADAITEQLGYGLPDKSFTFIYDPSDPFVYFAMDDMLAEEETPGGTESPPDSDPPTDPNGGDAQYELNAVGFSLHSGIPFAPETNWGLPDGTGVFHGNVILDGSVTVYGIEIEGEIVAHAGLDGTELGVNGEASIGFDVGEYSLEFPLGEASVGMHCAPFDVDVWFSGEVELDALSLEGIGGTVGSLLPPEVPLSVTGTAQVAGYVDSNGIESFDAGFSAAGDFEIGAGVAALGLDPWSIDVAGELSLDSNGYFVSGSTSATIHPSLQFAGAVNVEASFPFANPADWYLSMHGELSVSGTELGHADVLLCADGLFVDGAFSTPVTQIELIGQITAAGPYLAGFASIDLGEHGLGQVLVAAQEAVDAAQAALGNLDDEMAVLITQIEAERAAALAVLADAQTVVGAAQATVASLQSQINFHYGMIAQRQAEISSWYSWYLAQPWWNSAWAWGVYVTQSGWRNAEIAGRHVTIGTLTAARTVATAVLNVAELALGVAQQAVASFPIEADPRVVALQVLSDVALVALDVAEAVLAAIPPLPELMAELSFELDIHGMEGSVRVNFGGVEIVGHVTIGQSIELSIEVGEFGEITASI